MPTFQIWCWHGKHSGDRILCEGTEEHELNESFLDALKLVVHPPVSFKDNNIFFSIFEQNNIKLNKNKQSESGL